MRFAPPRTNAVRPQVGDAVWVGSTDGSVHIFDGASLEPLRQLQPEAAQSTDKEVGCSVVRRAWACRRARACAQSFFVNAILAQPHLAGTGCVCEAGDKLTYIETCITVHCSQVAARSGSAARTEFCAPIPCRAIRCAAPPSKRAHIRAERQALPQELLRNSEHGAGICALAGSPPPDGFMMPGAGASASRVAARCVPISWNVCARCC